MATPTHAGGGDFGMGADTALEGRARSGASWFYWVAALSFINSVLIWVGAPFIFIFGSASRCSSTA